MGYQNVQQRSNFPSASSSNEPAQSTEGRLNLGRLARGLAVRGLFTAAQRLVPAESVLTDAAGGGAPMRVERDVRYIDAHCNERLLDVHRPAADRASRDSGTGSPAVIHVHGGGFRWMSRQTHEAIARTLAAAGYVVFNVGYRLAPEHPFPAAHEDVAAVYGWVIRNAARYGVDTSRLALVGESAGANLVLATAIAACFERPEPWARRVFELGVVPRAVVPACGLLQTTSPERYRDELRGLSGAVAWWELQGSCEAYLGERVRGEGGGEATGGLADPLCILEGEAQPARSLPPVFAPVGADDPIREDTTRLADALARRGASVAAPVYEGAAHAFHAFWWSAPARACWGDLLGFLDRELGDAARDEQAREVA